MRLGIKRNDYKIPSGLYIVGEVNEKSPILVTCNYKLTFDCLRKNLDNRGYYILVLDTFGINVWCAAGKGTFSSRELIYQINKTNLKNIVKTKKLILPQLGASSIEPHLVRKHTGFKVIYGPVRSEDINKFIENDYKCDEDMRSVKFNLLDRLVLTPLEFIINMKYVFLIYLFFLSLNFINNRPDIILNSLYNTLPFLVGNILGSIVFPALLYIMPFRSFSLNGALIGAIYGVGIIFNKNIYKYDDYSLTGILLLLISFISYISFNFTGSTTYTSFSGVKKESRFCIPMFIVLSIIGIIVTIISIFI